MKARFILLVLLIFCFERLSTAQELTLFRYVDRTAVVLSSKERAVLEGIEALPTSLEVSLVNAEGVSALATAQTLTLPLPQRAPLRVSRAYMRTNRTGFIWAGTLPNQLGRVLFTVTGKSVSGHIQFGQTLYSLKPLGGYYHALILVDASKFPAEEPTHSSVKRSQAWYTSEEKTHRYGSNFKKGAGTSSVTDNPVIDILVAYTPAVAYSSGDIDNLVADCEGTTIDICGYSGAAASVNVVHSVEVSYSESGLLETDLSRLHDNGDGYMDNVHTIRQRYKADVVVLLVNSGDAGGLAYAIPASYAAQAFAVVVADQAADYYSFAHEVGHLIGGRHEITYDNSMIPYTYCHGFLKKGAWKTVMAVDPYTPTRLANWSNPYITHDGVAMGSVDTAYVASVWNQRAPTIAGFLTPPSVIYVPSEYNIDSALYFSLPGTRVIVTSCTQYVNQNLTVDEGVWLDIQSNVTLNFSGSFNLHVEGKLTTSSGDLFTSNSQWNGIELWGASSSTHITGCTIENASIGLYVYGTNYFSIDHCTIQNNSTGIASISSPHTISTNYITGNTYGVSCTDYSQVDFQLNNWVKFNNYGISIDNTSTPYLGTEQNPVYCSIWGNDWDVTSNYGGTTSAQYNYWGSYPANPMIYGNVDYSNELTAEPSLGKRAPLTNIPTSSRADYESRTANTDTIGMAELDHIRALERNSPAPEVQAAFGSLIARHPDKLAAFVALAHLSRLIERSGIDAIQPLSVYVSKYKGSALADFAKVLTGQILIRKGDSNAALTLFAELTQVPGSPFERDALYNAGCILWYRNEAKSEAEKYLRILIDKYPNDLLGASARATLGEPPVRRQVSQGQASSQPTPASYGISAAYPNPFNPTSTIRYQLPTDGYVRLVVFDLLGRQIAELATGLHAPGRYSATWNASSVASGMYFARLTVTDESGQMKYDKINKLVLAK